VNLTLILTSLVSLVLKHLKRLSYRIGVRSSVCLSEAFNLGSLKDSVVFL